MKQRPVGDRPGKVRGKAAARRIGEVDAEDVALVVEADVIADQEIVALARGGHVVVAVGADLDRAPEPFGGNRGQGGELVGLRLLAAKAAAHAPDLDGYGMRRNAERMRHHVLHFARMLGRGIDGHVLVLARHGKRNMAFQVEMVLATDPHMALETARRRRDRGRSVAALELERRRYHPALDRIEAADIDDRRQLLVARLGEQAGAPCGLARLGDDQEDRLAEELDLVGGQHRLVMAAGGADVVFARHVGGGEHVDHPGGGAHRVEVERADQAMRDRSEGPRQPCSVPAGSGMSSI